MASFSRSASVLSFCRFLPAEPGSAVEKRVFDFRALLSTSDSRSGMVECAGEVVAPQMFDVLELAWKEVMEWNALDGRCSCVETGMARSWLE